MWYGWTGTGLEVDLSRDKIHKSEGDRVNEKGHYDF